MDTTKLETDHRSRPRPRPIGSAVAWEAEVAEARAELDAGLYVDSAEIGAWIDSIGANHELPRPLTRRR